MNKKEKNFTLGLTFSEDYRGAWNFGLHLVFVRLYIARDAKGRRYIWSPPFIFPPKESR